MAGLDFANLVAQALACSGCESLDSSK